MAKKNIPSRNNNILYIVVAILLIFIVIIFSKKPASLKVPQSSEKGQSTPILKEIPYFSVKPPAGWKITPPSNASEDVLLSYVLVSPDYASNVSGGIEEITSGAEIWVQALSSKHNDIESYKSQAMMLKNSTNIEVAGVKGIRSDCGHPTPGTCVNFIKDGVLYQITIFPEGNVYESTFQEVVSSVTFD